MNIMQLNKKTLLGFAAFFVISAFVVAYVVYDRTTHDTRISANGAPQENTFYAAVQDGHPVLFYRYSGLMIAYKHADPFTGFIVPYDQQYSVHDHKKYGDFRQLENPKRLLTFDGFARVDNFKLSEDKSHLVISVMGGVNDSTNFIYQVNLKTFESKTLWQQELRPANNPSLGGIAFIETFIPDKYVVFALVKGDPPPSNPPANVIVKNIETGDEKVLGSVGSSTIDITAGTISFKQYEKIKEPCPPNDPVCFATDEYKIVNKPSGQTLSQPLP